MTIDICIPYGTLKEESRFLMLLGAFLKGNAIPVQQLLCDGVMEVCHRDSYLGFRRGMQSCLECSFEQERLAAWGDVPPLRLSQYADGQAVTSLLRSLALAGDAQLPYFCSSDAKAYWPLLEPLFQSRFRADYDSRNKLHVAFARKLLHSAGSVDDLLRAHFRHSDNTGAALSFGLDFFSQLFALRAHEAGRPVLRVSWDKESSRCRVCHPYSGELMDIQVVLAELLPLGPDLSRWPDQALDEFAHIAESLGISLAQSREEAVHA